MLQFLESEAQLIVKSGFLYLPLLFDPGVEKELRDISGSKPAVDSVLPTMSSPVLESQGVHYAQALSLTSIINNYEHVDSVGYDRLRRNILPGPRDDSSRESILPGGKLRTILLEIMPHFIRKNKGRERRRFTDDDMLDLVSHRLSVPGHFLERAKAYADTEPLQRTLEELDRADRGEEPAPEGPVSLETLRQWARKALEARIVSCEKARLREEIAYRAQLEDTKLRHMAALLYIAETGSFDLDGFGFSRIGAKDEYIIYKWTGEYILKDYYDQSYRFPGCRVAVSTAGPLRPIVLERYKHPFLFGYTQNQEICMRGYDWPSEFNAENVIRVLEDGINSLLYGYDARRRNGYHSLDPTLYYVKGIEFVEYRLQRVAD